MPPHPPERTSGHFCKRSATGGQARFPGQRAAAAPLAGAAGADCLPRPLGLTSRLPDLQVAPRGPGQDIGQMTPGGPDAGVRVSGAECRGLAALRGTAVGRLCLSTGRAASLPAAASHQGRDDGPSQTLPDFRSTRKSHPEPHLRLLLCTLPGAPQGALTREPRFLLRNKSCAVSSPLQPGDARCGLRALDSWPPRLGRG